MNSYKEAQQHQLSEWVAGRPWHNPFNHDDTRHDGNKGEGECCPDFSCCGGNLMPDDVRKEFAENPESRDGIMAMGLGGMLAGHGCDVSMSDGTEFKGR